MPPSRVVILLSVLCLGAVVFPPGSAGQEEDGCFVLCAPDLAFEPTISVENLASRHRTATLRDGLPVDTALAEGEAVFEVILAVGIPTEIPRVDLTLEAIWAPFAGTDVNPFTGRSADEAGEDEIGDNAVELVGSLDYMVTGIPEAGDRLDGELFLDDASPWSFPFALVAPLEP